MWRVAHSRAMVGIGSMPSTLASRPGRRAEGCGICAHTRHAVGRVLHKGHGMHYPTCSAMHTGELGTGCDR